MIVAAAAASMLRSRGEVRALEIGVGAAWLASSVSAAALMFAKPVSARAFWWAFGGGVALRLLVLLGLMVYSVYAPRLSQPALLLAYVFGVLGFLLLEYRHIRLK